MDCYHILIPHQTATPLDQLEVWSGLHHRRDHPINPINVLKLSAVLGDCDGHPETSYQLTPVFTGECVVMVTDSSHNSTPLSPFR